HLDQPQKRRRHERDRLGEGGAVLREIFEARESDRDAEHQADHDVACEALGFHAKSLGDADPPQANTFRKTVMINAFAKSMKNTPTIGATKNARGAGPYRSTSVRITAIAFAAVPSMKPMNPPL